MGPVGGIASHRGRGLCIGIRLLKTPLCVIDMRARSHTPRDTETDSSVQPKGVRRRVGRGVREPAVGAREI